MEDSAPDLYVKKDSTCIQKTMYLYKASHRFLESPKLFVYDL